uniref:RHS repeat domain-containing protein n=1 Tax=Kordia jejudonensis TaxID=1348245 RepID=UPI000AA2EF96
LSYEDLNNDGTIDITSEIKEENNYYPFGLKQKGYNNLITGRNHNYGFGGKEENDELGLQWLDFSARNYDASLGRWMNIDPLAEDMRRHSPYNYAFNNPIFFVDPDGMKPFGVGDGDEDKIIYEGSGTAVSNGDKIVENQLEEVIITATKKTESNAPPFLSLPWILSKITAFLKPKGGLYISDGGHGRGGLAGKARTGNTDDEWIDGGGSFEGMTAITKGAKEPKIKSDAITPNNVRTLGDQINDGGNVINKWANIGVKVHEIFSKEEVTEEPSSTKILTIVTQSGMTENGKLIKLVDTSIINNDIYQPIRSLPKKMKHTNIPTIEIDTIQK